MGGGRVWNGAIFKKPENHPKGCIKIKMIQRVLLTLVVAMMICTRWRLQEELMPS
jgi:hypothetical protein